MMLWAPHPGDVVPFRATGAGNMGDVTDDRSTARFSLPTKFVLVYLVARFTGGSSFATMTLRRDHRDIGGFYDFAEFEWLRVGTGDKANISTRIPIDEYPRYVYQPGDVLVLEWTNPNTQRWAVEVGLADATNIVAADVTT